MKNGLMDMENHLFLALERLNDDDVCHDKESTLAEVQRAEAIREVAEAIIEGGELMLKHAQLKAKYGCVETDSNPLFLEKK